MSEIEESLAELHASEDPLSISSDLSFETSTTEKMAADDLAVSQGSYESVRRKRKNRHRSPDVHLGSYESESHKDDALSNGLNPMEVELISSTTISSTKTESEYSDKSMDDIVSLKISREMKNLRRSTNDSKILTDYLNSTHESPRSRRRTPAPLLKLAKDTELEPEDFKDAIEDINPEEIEEMEVEQPPKEQEEEKTKPSEEADHMEEGEDDIEEVEEEDEVEEEEDEAEVKIDEVQESFSEEIKMKESPQSTQNDEIDSDATMVLPMEPPNKRRKSVPRSRSRLNSTFRSRKKSVHQQLKDEMSVTSDKEDFAEDEEEDVSEASFVTRRSIDGRPVNPPPKPGWDSFCFKCHSDAAVLSLACSNCKCSYHRQCVRPNPIPKNVDEFVCTECRDIQNAESSNVNKYGHEKIDQNTLSEMLTFILEKMRTYPERDYFESDILVKSNKEPAQQLIVTQMSLKIIEDRIKNHEYKVSEAFVHDMKMLEHNWIVVDRTKSKSLKSMLKYVYAEINELEACVYCYQEPFVNGDWFVQPCKRTHLLIWAKLKGYPYWPAKVMSIDSRQHVDVRFFGAHDRAFVPATHCILFSDKDPNKAKGSTPTSAKNASKTQKGIADAMKEKDIYIEKLRELYGFRYASGRQTVNPNDLQGHIEYMLPGLKSRKEGNDDGAQKEKLTLKLVKGQSSNNYQVEQKTSEPRTPQPHKQSEKPKLYKVLSKNDDNTDNMDQSGKLQLIIKRKSAVEQEVEKVKKVKASDTSSEASEASVTTKGTRLYRRKSTKEVAARSKKTIKKEEKEVSVEPVAKKARHNEKQKQTTVDDDEDDSHSEASKPEAVRRKSRIKSVLPDSDKPLVVPRVNPVVIPPGTDEIEELKDDSSSTVPKVQNRGKRPPRSQSIGRASSLTTKGFVRARSESVSTIGRKTASDLKETNSNQEIVANDRKTSPVREKKPEESPFNPHLVIKDEPVSDCEEIVERNALTEKDFQNLIQDKRVKKTTIVISTVDGEPSHIQQHQSPRARKTFPNHPNQLQLDGLITPAGPGRSDWMVCIPQSFSAGNSSVNSPPTSNRSTPASEPQLSISQVRPAQPPVQRQTQNMPVNSTSSVIVAPVSSNRSQNMNIVPPLAFNSPNDIGQPRREPILPNQIFVNGQRPAPYPTQSSFVHQRPLPELHQIVPRTQGVFANDGTMFNRDVGPVSRMLTDNAHRISDFFRQVLVDSISAFSPDTPSAENMMLRAEKEKLQRDMQVTKSECQQTMQQLRREHQEELEQMTKDHESKIAKMKIEWEKEKAQIKNEIRQQCESEKQRAIENTKKETKKMTWCSNCTKEARFYCCWNTSYCGPQCQKTHWQHHQKYCTNKNSITEPQQLMVKQIDPQSLPPPPPVVAVRPPQTLILRPTQQLQQMAPPVSIQQQILLPAGVQASPAPQQFFVASYANNTRTIRAIYPDHMRENVYVKAIHRSEEPNVTIMQQLPVTDAMIQQANVVVSSQE